MSQSTRPLFWALSLGVSCLLMVNLAYGQYSLFNTTTVTETSTITITKNITVTVNPAQAEGSLLAPVFNWGYDRIVDLAYLVTNSPSSPWILVVIFGGFSIIFMLMYLRVR